ASCSTLATILGKGCYILLVSEQVYSVLEIFSMNKSLAIHVILIYFDSVTTPDNFEIFSFIVMDPE
ncbi:hypothetical protein Gotur_029590, partial [Gossypium turneri]